MLPSRNAVFVDTAGWVEPMLRSDPNHVAMMQYAQDLHATQRPLVTTDDILNEVVALLTTDSRGMPRSKLIQFVNQIRGNAGLRIVHVDEAVWHEAWAMLERMSDKAWSLVDASSFVVMRHLGITEAFTSDHHFTQAGFIRAPQP
jgi:uncharacterized protein